MKENVELSVQSLRGGFRIHPILYETKYTSLCYMVGDVLVTALEQNERMKICSEDTPSDKRKNMLDEV